MADEHAPSNMKDPNLHVLIRKAADADIEALTDLWWEGWRDAHLHIVPQYLSDLRTRANFRARLIKRIDGVWLSGELGEPLGFHFIHGDELDQFYVARQARGTGLATRLMLHAESIFEGRGILRPWLACTVGNARAARFYEKSGWERIGERLIEVETSESPFPVKVWRYERTLG